MVIEELQTVDTPLSDLSAGIACGIGLGLAIGLAVFTGC
jgi:hypothetical protein